MAAPTTVFYCIDDTGPAGGGSGQQVCPDFIAPTAAAATSVASIIATVLQRQVRLVQKFNASGPFAAVPPGPANVALTAVPSGCMGA